MAKVLVSVPNTSWVHKHVVFALLRLQLNSLGHKLTIILPTHIPIENNQHHILNDFMAGDYDYWLSFDSDNPPTRNPLELIELDKDIIGCPTPVYHFDEPNHPKGDSPIYWNGYKTQDYGYTEHPHKEGLQEVDAVGTGCILIARRVFENPEMRKAPFNPTYNDDGTWHKGNDMMMCERAKKQGFRVWAHYDYVCLHFNEIELSEVFRAFQQAEIN